MQKQMSSTKASLVRSKLLLQSGNLSRLTLWWVTGKMQSAGCRLCRIAQEARGESTDGLADETHGHIKSAGCEGMTTTVTAAQTRVQGSVLSPLLFDLFLNALLRLLDATGITHGTRRIPQWKHAAFADDLSIYVCTVRDANKLLDVIHEFEFWSGLRTQSRNL